MPQSVTYWWVRADSGGGPHGACVIVPMHSAARPLQAVLNKFPGVFLKVDGVPGVRTSDAFNKVTGHFLMGDRFYLLRFALFTCSFQPDHLVPGSW